MIQEIYWHWPLNLWDNFSVSKYHFEAGIEGRHFIVNFEHIQYKKYVKKSLYLKYQESIYLLGVISKIVDICRFFLKPVIAMLFQFKIKNFKEAEIEKLFEKVAEMFLV